MSDMTKFDSLFEDFGNAIKRFEEVIALKKNDIVRDSAIKRFEITFDLSWKTIKACLEKQGVICASPLGCFREAFRQGILDNDEIWVDMVDTRNKTAHTYDESKAEEVYAKLPATLGAFQKLFSKLKN